MSKVYVDWFSSGAEKARLRKDLIVVIDVLRCASLIVTALSSGVRRVIVCSNPSEAIKLKELMVEDCFLAGESNGVKPEEFDLNNSPTEFLSRISEFKGKTMILTTSLGAKAIINAASQHRPTLIGCLLNSRGVSLEASRLLRELNADLTIICSGFLSQEFSIEDFIGAGSIIANLPEWIERSEEAALAEFFYKNAWREEFMLIFKNSRAYRKLLDLNADRDIEFCLKKDVYSTVPKAVKRRLNDSFFVEVIR